MDNPVTDLFQMCFRKTPLRMAPTLCISCEAPTRNGIRCMACADIEALEALEAPDLWPLPLPLLDAVKLVDREHDRLVIANAYFQGLLVGARTFGGELYHPTIDVSMERYKAVITGALLGPEVGR